MAVADSEDHARTEFDAARCVEVVYLEHDIRACSLPCVLLKDNMNMSCLTSGQSVHYMQNTHELLSL